MIILGSSYLFTFCQTENKCKKKIQYKYNQQLNLSKQLWKYLHDLLVRFFFFLSRLFSFPLFQNSVLTFVQWFCVLCQPYVSENTRFICRDMLRCYFQSSEFTTCCYCYVLKSLLSVQQALLSLLVIMGFSWVIKNPHVPLIPGDLYVHQYWIPPELCQMEKHNSSMFMLLENHVVNICTLTRDTFI